MLNDELVALDEQIIYCYRFMWTEKNDNSDRVCFRLVTDLKEGIITFAKAMLATDTVEKLTAEYLCEYNSAMLGYVVPVDSVDNIAFKFVDFAHEKVDEKVDNNVDEKVDIKEIDNEKI